MNARKMLQTFRRSGGTVAIYFSIAIYLLGFQIAKAAESPALSGTLRLLGGDVFRGSFAALATNEQDTTDSERRFLWDCPSFARPIEIPWEQMEALAFSRRPSVPLDPDSRRFVLEYWSGECISGLIESLDHEQIELLSDRFERQIIPTSQIRTALRIVEVEKEAGLLAAEDWGQTAPVLIDGKSRRWSTKVGAIQTETAGAVIEQRVHVPDVSSMEIETAWSHSSPNWILTLGTPRRLQLHLRKIEHRNALAITLLFEERENADISTAIIPFEGLESIRLRILSDYIRGRFALQYRGKTIAEIRGKEKQRSGGVQSLVFTNVAPGGVTLRELRVSRSVFSLPENSSPESKRGSQDASGGSANGFTQETPKVILLNSEDYTGVPTGFRSEDHSFTFLGSAQSLGRVKLSSVERIEFASQNQVIYSSDSTSPRFFVELQDGSRFSCREILHHEDSLWLESTSIQKRIQCKIEEVASIYVQRYVPEINAIASKPIPDLRMRLKTANAISVGVLQGSQNGVALPSPEDKGLFWRSEQLQNAAPLHRDIDGLVETIPGGKRIESKASAEKNAVPASSLEQYGRLLATGEPSLYLASGDSVPARLESLHAGKLTLDCEYFGKVDVSVEQVRGFRFLAYTGLDGMDRNVLKRMLTVPRLSRNRPPLNLVVSRGGDVIRGNIVSMNQETIQMEVRGEVLELSGKNVAEVVWMPLPGADADGQGVEGMENRLHTQLDDAGLPCQVIMDFGTSIGLHASGIRDEAIQGTHPLLGACELPLSSTVRVLFGSEIELNARESRFSRWRLRHAIDPKFVQQEQEAAALASGNSKWIGVLAPEFKLDMLDGSSTELSSRHGRVVVIEFWASWCKPCRSSLVELAGIVSQFPGSDVEMVAMNVEEPVQLARSAAATMGLHGLIAIDRKGEVAKTLEVPSMPYTLIIDRKGIIRGVFTGASEDNAGKIREAISAALENDELP